MLPRESEKKIKAICTVLISCTVCIYFAYELEYYRWTSVKHTHTWLPRGWWDGKGSQLSNDCSF